MRSWSTARRRFRHGVLAMFAILLASMTSLSTWADTRDQAKKIYDRIAGVPPDEATITAMADLLDNGNQADAVAAAMMAMEADEFYSVTLKNFAAPGRIATRVSSFR